MRQYGVATLPNLAALPGSGVAGQVCFVSNVLYQWNTVSASWQATTSFIVTAKSASYTEATLSGEIIILATSTAGTFTITLPTAVGNTAKFTIKKQVAINQVIIQANGAQTIDGGNTATLNNQYESITFVSDGANWQII